MALRIRFQYFSGALLGYSIERLGDGFILDLADMTFKTTPINAIGQLTEGTAPYSGIYRTTITNTPIAQFSNGNYAISIHRIDMNNTVLGLLRTTMVNGDDNNVVTSGGGSTTVDINAVAKGVWDYGVGNATTTSSLGKLLKDNMDVPVSSRSTFAGGPVQSVTNPVTVGTNQDKSGYSLASSALDSITSAVSKNVWDYSMSTITLAGSVGKLLKDNMDVPVSSRSTFAGGPVQSVTNPVTVGTNQDKSGYSLASSALDSITSAVSKNVWDYSMSTITLAGSVGKLLKDNMDVPVSSRSTFAGGAVLSVTNPVTVGTNQDKSGYSLATSGLDLISVEQGINIRQAIAPILAATAGVISGAGTGQIVIRGGNTSVSRILASTDNQGNRTSVTLILPS